MSFDGGVPTIAGADGGVRHVGGIGGGGGGIASPWILEEGIWNDAGIWIDLEYWEDGAQCANFLPNSEWETLNDNNVPFDYSRVTSFNNAYVRGSTSTSLDISATGGGAGFGQAALRPDARTLPPGQ